MLVQASAFEVYGRSGRATRDDKGDRGGYIRISSTVAPHTWTRMMGTRRSGHYSRLE